MTQPRLLTRLEIDDGAFYPEWSCEDVIRKRTVIFGRNGCGKSTLVRHLRTASHPDSAVKAETDLEILVFNADYVRENLAGVSTGTGLSSALFVTGSVNVEIESDFDAAAKRKDRIDRLTSIASKMHSSRKKVLKQALEAARDQVRPLAGEFGAMQAPTAEDKLRKADACTNGEDQEDRQVLATTLASIPDAVDDIPDDLIAVNLSEILEVLRRDVSADASAALASLTPKEREWIQQGAELHEHRSSCLLCENILVPPRSALLAAMRTQELLQLRRDLERFRQTLDEQTKVTESLITDLQTKTKTRRIDTSAVDLEEVANELRAVAAYLEALSACVAQKAQQPQETVEVPVTDPPPTQGIDQLRSIIVDQNKRWEQQRRGLANEQSSALARCVGRLGVTHLPRIDEARSGVKIAQRRLDVLDAERYRQDERIKELQASRLQADRAEPLAEQLTRNLRSYLGHDELTVRVEVEGDATGFVLYRSDGHRASGLSEGECTAISLLHFITSLQESDRLSKLAETCVVLDDPVSSLDGQSIRNAFHYIVNALVGEGEDDPVGQCIIFTHNEAFFGLWREKLTKNLKQLGERNALLRLDTHRSEPGVQRRPVLEAFPRGAIRYRSEYYRLFDKVASAVEDPSNFIDQGIANIARRLMESFARWKTPDADKLDGSLKKLLEQGSAVSQTDRFGSVFQFLQSGSHFEEINIDTEGESVSNYRADVVACLALMRAADSGHFEGMFRAVRYDKAKTDMDDRLARFCEVLDQQSPLSDAVRSGAGQ